MENKLVCLSFFSGALGLDMGLEAAGLYIRLACEINPQARATIHANRPSLPLLDDVRMLTAEHVRMAAGIAPAEDIFVVAGGPPCQSFSTAGRRQAFQDHRGSVLLTYVTLALELRPRYIVFENVRGLLSASGPGEPRGSALNDVLLRLQNEGYETSFELYNAANFGVPQCRERVIIIASREGGRVPYLTPTHASPALAASYGMPPWRTFRDATTLHPSLKEADAVGLSFPEKRLRFYRELSAGQNWRQLPVDMQQEAMGKAFLTTGGRTGFYRRLAWDAPSPTLTTSPTQPATDLAHPTMDRPLSIQEYKRLQQFSDDFVVKGTLRDQYRQLGNAVPVGLGHAIGVTLLAHYQGHSRDPPAEFRFSRYRNTDDVSWSALFNATLK